jgi:hypothetical protein
MTFMCEGPCHAGQSERQNEYAASAAPVQWCAHVILNIGGDVCLHAQARMTRIEGMRRSRQAMGIPGSINVMA